MRGRVRKKRPIMTIIKVDKHWTTVPSRQLPLFLYLRLALVALRAYLPSASHYVRFRQIRETPTPSTRLASLINFSFLRHFLFVLVSVITTSSALRMPPHATRHHSVPRCRTLRIPPPLPPHAAWHKINKVFLARRDSLSWLNASGN